MTNDELTAAVAKLKDVVQSARDEAKQALECKTDASMEDVRREAQNIAWTVVNEARIPPFRRIAMVVSFFGLLSVIAAFFGYLQVQDHLKNFITEELGTAQVQEQLEQIRKDAVAAKKAREDAEEERNKVTNIVKKTPQLDKVLPLLSETCELLGYVFDRVHEQHPSDDWPHDREDIQKRLKT